MGLVLAVSALVQLYGPYGRWGQSGEVQEIASQRTLSLTHLPSASTYRPSLRPLRTRARAGVALVRLPDAVPPPGAGDGLRHGQRHQAARQWPPGLPPPPRALCHRAATQARVLVPVKERVLDKGSNSVPKSSDPLKCRKNDDVNLCVVSVCISFTVFQCVLEKKKSMSVSIEHSLLSRLPATCCNL